MAFPVLGQLLGLVLVFGLTFLYTVNLPGLISGYKIFNSLATIVLCVVFIVLPGMLVWAKAFLDYLVTYGALNSMTQGALTTGKVYDFKAHNQTVTRKIFSFIGLWFLFGIFTFLSAIPFFWVPGLILFVYFVLIFQVFIFEEKVSPIGCFIKSFQLIKGRFAKTFGLMLILFIFTYWLLPAGVSVLFEAFSLMGILTAGFTSWVDVLPIDALYLLFQRINIIISPVDIAGFMSNNVIAFIVIGLTLPLRSICWSLWYKNLAEPVQENKKRKNNDVSVQEL
jgi:hypothetical protein